MKRLQATGEIPHLLREALAVELFAANFNKSEIFEFNKVVRNFDERVTTQQLNQIERVGYKTWTFKRLQQDKFCIGCHRFFDQDLVIEFGDIHGKLMVTFNNPPHDLIAYCKRNQLGASSDHNSMNVTLNLYTLKDLKTNILYHLGKNGNK